MQRFARLIDRLTATTRTNDKKEALVAYLSEAPDADKLWLVALFTGRRPKGLASSALLRAWAMEAAGLSEWLFGECYHAVGDLAETISLVLPPMSENPADDLSLRDMMEQLIALQSASEQEKKHFITRQWQQLPRQAVFVFNKLITGGFRIGVSANLLVQALAAYLGREVQEVAHMVTGNWNPATASFSALFLEGLTATDESKPYPFFLAYALEGPVASLGTPEEWQVEWKWDGIRGQLIKRNGALYLWSRGEELITDKFPELRELAVRMPDGVVLDGEILCYREGRPLPFQYLQTRIGRKNVSRKQLEEAPVVFMAYDLLEKEGRDIRSEALSLRRQWLEQLVAEAGGAPLVLSSLVAFGDWEVLPRWMEQVREQGVEGFMLKRRSSVYQAGRRRGDWWKWKVQPLTVDAVLIYAQKGHGKRSSLYTDYTFAVRDAENGLVPFAKAYSGLTDKEIVEVDRFVRRNSLEQFGPVRTVKPELVFEIAFEGISASSRHKSGVAVRFPRILRWRTDKQADEINTLEELKQLLHRYSATRPEGQSETS